MLSSCKTKLYIYARLTILSTGYFTKKIISNIIKGWIIKQKNTKLVIVKTSIKTRLK